MKTINICFWLNVQSKHQSLFLEELYKEEIIKLKVYYFDKVDENRAELGWSDGSELKDYESNVSSLNKTLSDFKDWKEYIHIVMGYGFPFNKQLIPKLIDNDVKWVHWSERYGIGLAQKLNLNVFLFSLLRPLFLYMKRDYGILVQKYAYGCFAQGKLAKQDFVKMGIREEKISNLFYTSEVKQQTKKERSIDKVRYLFVGQLSTRKGTLDLLKAFKIVNENENCELYLVGQDTSNGEYLHIAKKLKIDKDVYFKGIIPFQKIYTIYNECDIFVFPSRYDGWGAVLNEAASTGMPIIASDQTGSAYHIIEENKNGYMIKSSSVTALVKAMNIYKNDTKLISIHGSYSLEIIKNFTPQANVKRFLSAIEKWKIND